MVPRTVLTRSGSILLNTAKLVNTVQPRTTVNNARPIKNVINNAYSTARRPFNKITESNNSNFTKKVNTARPKAILSAVKGSKGNVVKASACWGNPQQDLKNKGVIDSGCSRHMTGNRSYLTDYEEIDGGFVAFGGNSKGGKITGKGKIRTGKLDFEDVYFVKELKFNLFSVSQMCDKKNSVLFTDTECVVLSPDFKLTDESHVLLKVPRKDNMYSVDLKNVVPQGGLTCLFAKATPNESNLWHRRLGHVNFKTMNKLVRGNLVRGLPSKLFEINQTCVACQKGKQHRASYHLGKFDGKADEGFFVGYSTNSKAFRVKQGMETERRRDSSHDQAKDDNINNTNNVNAVSSTVNAAGIEDNVVDENIVYGCTDDPNIFELEDIVYSDDDEDVGVEADMNNLDAFMSVIPIPAIRIHKDHPVEQIIRDLNSAPQTRRMTKNLKEHEPKKVIQALKDPSWIEAMQDELLQFKLQKGYTQEEGIDYDEFFVPVAKIKAIRLFLAYASFKDFVVYQMDVKSAFIYGKIKEEVYVYQPPGFEDLDFPDKVYKVEKALYGLHQAPKALKVKSDILLVQVDVKTARTPMETQKALLKDADGKDVDEHLYRSMIGSLMYLTSSRLDIMFAVCACARFQVNPKVSHLHAVKRIFRYLKGQPKLGLWYPKDSPFDLVAYTDNDYAGASLDRKSITGGCQFLGCMLISWQCKKQTVVANSTTEAEYIAASNCYRQSTICIVKNPVFHSKTKHIEIRHHFIRDSNEKKLIQMIKIHTDQNVADLLTKAFDVSRFQYLIASIRMLNL
ncbi:putative ribonuclease H-like domain-containing protein [Tanacetum coccineum]|uniref:Ribonuclease H-like domain-containing protein n=1 Tax=Tanacetum coccineum TaxID=301880 RepID=A0ABQ5E5P0_9ASTR